MEKVAEGKKGMQHLRETKEARSAGRSPQTLKEVRKTVVNFSRLKASSGFNSPGPLHLKGELPEQIQR